MNAMIETVGNSTLDKTFSLETRFVRAEGTWDVFTSPVSSWVKVYLNGRLEMETTDLEMVLDRLRQ